jgi:hypothetical protein
VAKILLQFQIDTQEGRVDLEKLKESLEAVGVTGTKVQEEMDKAERSFNKLQARLDPIIEASKKLAKNQQDLAYGLAQGKISSDQYAMGLVAVETQYYKTTSAGAGLLGQLQNLKMLMVGAAVGAGIGKGLGWLSDTTALAAESEAAQMKLEAMVRATGGAAGYTATQLEQMATNLSRLTGIEDENVKQAEAVLLTYKNIPREAFLPTLKAASDLAALMGTDLVDATRTLGIVLENPTAGMDRLRRGGLVLSDTVKAQVKDFEAHGRTVEAVNLLLAEFRARMGGVGEEMGGSFKNQLAKVGNEWRNVNEEMGLTWVSSAEGKQKITELAGGLGLLADAIKKAREAGGGGAGAGLMAGGIFGILAGGSLLSGPTAAVGQLLQILRSYYDLVEKGYSVAVPPKSDVSPQAGGTVDAAKAWEEYTKQVHAAVLAMDKFLASQQKLEDIHWQTALMPAALAMTDFANTIEKATTIGGTGRSPAADAFAASFGEGLRRSFEGDMRLTTEKTFSDFANYVGTHIGMVMGEAAGETFPDWMVKEAQKHAQAGTFADTLGDYFSGAIKDNAKLDAAYKETSRHFGTAFQEGFMAVVTGKDAQSEWKKFSDGLAAVAAQSMGKMLTEVMGGNTQWTGEGGILAAGGLWKDGKFNTGGALMMGGGLVSAYASQQNSQGMGALGGAMTGAGMAWQTANPIIIAAAAIIMAVVGYYSSAGQKSYGYDVYAGAVGTKVNVGYGGPDTATMADMQRQLADKMLTVTTGFRDLMRQMGQGNVLPVFGKEWQGSTKEFGQTFKTILESELPAMIVAAYKPLLAAGMGGLGIGAGRIGQELGQFDTSQFATAMANLQAYVGAVIRLRDLHADLSKSLTTLRTELTQGIQQTWRAGIKATLSELGDLTKNLDQLTSQEQVARAGQIADLTEQQYKTNLQYLQQIFQVQANIKATIDSTLLSFEQQTAQEKDAAYGGSAYQSGWLKDQLEAGRQQLLQWRMMPQTGSPEQVQDLINKMSGWAAQYWKLNPDDPTGGMYGGGSGGYRTWVEQFIKDQGKSAQDLLDYYARQLKDSNDPLRWAIDSITTALQTETDVRATLLGALEDEAGAIGGATERLDRFADAVDSATASLDALSAGGGRWA